MHSLHTEAATLTPDVGPAVIMPLHCDRDGAVFLRQFDPQGRSPVLKISADGKSRTVFDPSAAEKDLSTDLRTVAFTASADGTVYALAKTNRPQVYVVKFRNDGSYSGSVLLDHDFEPQQLGVFRTGDLFVSGVILVTAGKTPTYAPYAAIFDRQGNLVKQLKTREAFFQSGPAAGSQHASTGRRLSKHAEERDEMQTVPPELSMVEADDNYVYLLRQGATPTIFMISPIGTVDRRLSLHAPSYPNLQVAALRTGDGQMLLEYVQPKALENGNAAYYMTVYDTIDGSEIARYTRSSDVNGTLACTDWKGRFSFLGSKPEGPSLLIASDH